jgi:uncharacterized membrane protein SirB2
MEWIKTIHVSCVILSFSGFLLRGIWMMIDSAMLANKWVKIVPHIVDTMLLLSALLLVYLLGLSIPDHDWLLAKIIALVIYVLLGTVALKRGKTKKIKMMALILAMIIFLYIVSVAVTKSVFGFMSIA